MTVGPRELLARHGLRPRKALGQHFLLDPNVLRRIVGACALEPDDVAIEIGAGLGALTRALAATGARVIAVEKDARLCAALREDLPDNVELREQDALDLDLAAEARAAGRRPVVAGNLPYGLSTPILFRLIEARARVARAVIMVQREVADRIAAAHGGKDYGVLSVRAQASLSVEPVMRVSPACFHPRPEVESAVVRLVPRPDAPGAAAEAALARVARAAFARRRKTLRNTLAGVIDAAALARLGIDPGRRAETLSIVEFLAIARAVAAPGGAA